MQNYIYYQKEKEQIALINDDNEILKTIHNNLKDVILYQDSKLVDQKKLFFNTISTINSRMC